MPNEVYIGVDDLARKAKSLYVGVDDKARKIKKGYVGVDNKAMLFYQDYVKLTGLSLDRSVIKGYAAGSKIQLTPLYVPENTTERDIIWTPDSIVDSNGLVTVPEKGLYTVKALGSNDISASCDVYGRYPSDFVTSFSIYLNPGETYTFGWLYPDSDKYFRSFSIYTNSVTNGFDLSLKLEGESGKTYATYDHFSAGTTATLYYGAISERINLVFTDNSNYSYPAYGSFKITLPRGWK